MDVAPSPDFIFQETGWDSTRIAKSDLFKDQQRGLTKVKRQRKDKEWGLGGCVPHLRTLEFRFCKRHCAGNHKL